MIPQKWLDIEEDYPITYEHPVQWGDMDAARHVNNLVYLRWMETARIKFFEKVQMSTSFDGSDAGPILAWQDCKYVYPMTYPDTALMACKVLNVESDRFTMQCVVFSKKHQRLAAFSKQVIMAYSYKTLSKITLPEPWRHKIQEF